METLQLVLDLYYTFRAQSIHHWCRCLLWKMIMGELILMNLCRPALGVQFFLRHSVCSPIRKICKAIKNAKKWGGLEGSPMVTQGHRQHNHLIECIWLPLRLYTSILYRFRVLVIRRKWPILTHPTCICRPRRGWSRSNFAVIFGIRKLKSLGYRAALSV